MTISLPLTITIPRKTKEDKVFALNLNIYRNAHHMILNEAKVRWKDIVKHAVLQNPDAWFNSPVGPFHFTYTIYPGNKRAFDEANVLPIIEKFTDDALIELGVIKDDNYKIVRAIDYRFGDIDKDNPRCELTIERYEQ